MDATYTNPLFQQNFPDPFVLRFNGRYYAWATGPAGDGHYFPQAVSRDLVQWKPRGGALPPLDLPGAEEYWAPEVAYSGGRFYLYYAVGRDADPDHHLRVAVAEHPLGPWRDAGLNLTPHEIFAIDAHPFRDPRDGQWYLFYARDRLEEPYAGTGNVVDCLVSMTELAGKPEEVTRPYAEWQLFERGRPVKKGLDWYTVEGPFCLLAPNGRYCCLYSGGRWENPSYGVAYAWADQPLGPWHDEANAAGPTVLTTRPGRVVGPGHNCVVLGPDLVTPYLVYHGWDPGCTARLPRLDRLEWCNGEPACSGPSDTPQPAPRMPDHALWLDELRKPDPGDDWVVEGTWTAGDAGWTAGAGGASLALAEPFSDGAVEVCWRRGTLHFHLEEAGADAIQCEASESWSCLRLVRCGSEVSLVLNEVQGPRAEAAPGRARLELRLAAGAELTFVGVTRLSERGAAG